MTYSSKRIKIIPIGSKFGEITVIGEPTRHTTGKTTRAMFPCQCSCGKNTWITGSQLRSNNRLKCSNCAYKSRPQSTERLSNIERLYNLSIVSRCKTSKLINNLSIEEFQKIISKNCYYCGKAPRKIDHLIKNKIALREDLYANGVDRIDSKKDYNVDNCVPCCKQCNTMKNEYSLEIFLNQIKTIYEKWIKQDDIIKEKLDMN